MWVCECLQTIQDDFSFTFFFFLKWNCLRRYLNIPRVHVLNCVQCNTATPHPPSSFLFSPLLACLFSCLSWAKRTVSKTCYKLKYGEVSVCIEVSYSGKSRLKGKHGENTLEQITVSLFSTDTSDGVYRRLWGVKVRTLKSNKRCKLCLQNHNSK